MKPLVVMADIITRLNSVMTANSLCRSSSTACSYINSHKFRFLGPTDDSLRARALKSVQEWCKRNRHLPIQAQHDYLVRAIRGHCAYYGLRGNGRRLKWFRYQVARTWRKWLARRSRLRRMNWDRMNEFLMRYSLPSVSYARPRQSFLSEPDR